MDLVKEYMKLAAILTLVSGYQVAACQPSYTACQPVGATETALPPLGTDLSALYTDLLEAVKDVKAPPAAKVDVSVLNLVDRDDTQICCIDGTDCLNLGGFNIPFCYDRFTTNFFLADSSTGTLDDGTLRLADGPQVDLIHGDYTSAGTSGNIYGTEPGPNTATLPVPTPYTASGIGGAIPLTALAGIVTITTTIPGTTLPASTISGSLYTSTVIAAGSTVTVSASAPGTTIAGATVPPKTLTITVSGSGPSSSTSAAAAASASPDSLEGPGLVLGLAALLMV